MRPANPLVDVQQLPAPTPFVATMREYALTSQAVWEMADRSSALKLDWNEGTVAHHVVVDAIVEFLGGYGAVNWYPDVTCHRVMDLLSAKLGMAPEHLMVFPGSDVALDALVRTYVMPGDPVMVATPTYDNFRIYVESCGARVCHIKLSDPLGFDCPEFIQLIKAQAPHPKIIYLVNPNNPIGYLISPEEIAAILGEFPEALVILDEAYAEFAGYSALPLLQQFPNLIIARSFSKAFGLAGLRLGYLLGHPQVLAQVNKVRNPKNISMLAQVGAAALLERYELVEAYVAEVRAAREAFIEQMRARGAIVYESHANFVLMRVADPKAVLACLADHQIFARDRSYMDGLNGMIRITMGTRAQMAQVLAVFEEVPVSLWRVS